MQLEVAEIGRLWEPDKPAFYAALPFLAKCVVWDTVPGFGTTPPAQGRRQQLVPAHHTFLFQ
jgi:hypothetical protein